MTAEDGNRKQRLTRGIDSNFVIDISLSITRSADRSRRSGPAPVLMDQAEASAGRPDGSFRNFIVNVGGPDHRLRQVLWKVGSVQTIGDSLLAFATVLRHTWVHSKSKSLADRLRPQVPACECRRRHGDVGQADSGDFVAVGIDCGHQRAIRRPDPWRNDAPKSHLYELAETPYSLASCDFRKIRNGRCVHCQSHPPKRRQAAVGVCGDFAPGCGF